MEISLTSADVDMEDLVNTFKRVKGEEIDKQRWIVRDIYRRKWKGRVENRRMERRVRKDPRLEGIDVMDEELYIREKDELERNRMDGVEKVENSIIMDDMKLEECEKEYLRPPIKFRERTEEWLNELELELESNTVKERWESIMIDRKELGSW